MKKKLAVILALLLALTMALTGCERADILTKLTSLTGATTTYKAAVYYQGKWRYYDTCAQAWATANACNESGVIFQLLTDWVADSNGSFDDNGGYGDNGWGFYNGMLNFQDRGDDGGDKYSWFDVDLNGHTIDKNLYSAGSNHNFSNPVKNNRRENGRIFRFDGIDSNLNVHIYGGTLRGANSTGEGGALWMNDEDVNLTLTNVTITDNCSEKNGSAIYVDICDSLTLNNVDIEWNFCDEDSNRTAAVNFDDGDFYLYGTVHIRENFGRALINEDHGQNNIMMDAYFDAVDVNSTNHFTTGVKEFSEIHLTYVTGLANSLIQITEKTKNREDQNFTRDAFVLDKYLKDGGANRISIVRDKCLGRVTGYYFAIDYFDFIDYSDL